MSKQKWHAEHAIQKDLAQSLIEQQFPLLGKIHIELLGNGWDNTAFLVNNHYIFRFPRRQIAVPLLQQEIKLLPYLKTKLPLAIPFPQWVGHPTKHYPWPFAGYEKLSGVPAGETLLNETQRIANAKKLGEFLAILHAININDIQPYDVTIDSIGRLDLNKRLPMIKENFAIVTQQHWLDITVLQNYLEQIDSSWHENKLTFTHGDLYAKHLLVDNTGMVSGIIDWGDAELGHPAIDFAIAHVFLPPTAHSLFRQTYGYISDKSWELARIRAMYSASMIAIYADDVNDKNLFNEGLIGLRYLCEGLSSPK